MSDEQYVTYQRRIDDELTTCFYSQGLIPPALTPMSSTVAELEPLF